MKEHTEDYSLFYKHYDKILKCIESCVTEIHLYVCRKMMWNFYKRYAYKMNNLKFKLHYREILISFYVKEKMLGFQNL